MRRQWIFHPAEPTRRWQLGAVTVTKISEGVMHSALDLPSPEEGFLPFATRDALLGIDWLRPDFIGPQGEVLLAFHALVIDAPGLRVVVDTCIGSGKHRPHHPFWQGISGRFLEAMVEAGMPRESVGAVVCTHLHVDHVGWNTMQVDGRWVPTFPNARYLFGRREFEACARLHAAGGSDSLHPTVFMEDSVQPVFDAGLAQLVEADHRLCEEVRLVPTHGHTPGHVSVAIESQGLRALITGDAIHHPCQLTHTGWAMRADADPAAAVQTRRALLASHAGAGTLFIGTHWAGRSCGYVEREGDSYRLR